MKAYIQHYLLNSGKSVDLVNSARFLQIISSNNVSATSKASTFSPASNYTDLTFAAMQRRSQCKSNGKSKPVSSNRMRSVVNAGSVVNSTADRQTVH